MIKLTGDLNAVIYESTLTGKHPCLIFLHGLYERGDGTDKGLDILLNWINSPWNSVLGGLNYPHVLNGKREEFVLIAPQLPLTEGNWQTAYIDKAYQYALTRADVDPTRIAIAGFSLGGEAVLYYLSNPANKGKFSAGVVVAPAWTDRLNFKVIAASTVPLWFIHAQNDDVVNVGSTNTFVANINANNPAIPARKTILPSGGHTICYTAFDPTKSPGINGETATVWQWMLLNTNTVHVPVPTGIADKPADPLPTTLKAVATVTNLTATTATLDGSKSEGNPSYATWDCLKYPPKAPIDIWPNGWSKGGLVVNVSKLVSGEYLFELTVGKQGAAVSKNTVPVMIGAVKAPILKEGAVPPGSTKYILRTDNTIEFT